MTRKDFGLIASVIKSMRTSTFDLRAEKLVTARMFAEALQSTNPRFDPDKFLDACGV